MQEEGRGDCSGGASQGRYLKTVRQPEPTRGAGLLLRATG